MESGQQGRRFAGRKGDVPPPSMRPGMGAGCGRSCTVLMLVYYGIASPNGVSVLRSRPYGAVDLTGRAIRVSGSSWAGCLSCSVRVCEMNFVAAVVVSVG